MSRHFGNEVFHIATVTPDLDQAVDRMLASGIGPFYYARGLKLKSRYRGVRHDVVISVAFAYTGKIMFELVAQDNNAPSSFKEYLDRHPEGGLHHIAYMSDDLEASMKHAAEQGTEFVPVQEFLGADGKPVELYMEPKGQKNATFIQIVLPSAWDDAFKEMEGIAAKWDGSEPRRNMYDLLSPELVAQLDIAA